MALFLNSKMVCVHVCACMHAVCVCVYVHNCVYSACVCVCIIIMLTWQYSVHMLAWQCCVSTCTHTTTHTDTEMFIFHLFIFLVVDLYQHPIRSDTSYSGGQPNPQSARSYDLSYHTPPQHSHSGSFSTAVSHYRTYLKCVYKRSPISPDTKWPPSPGREFIRLAIVEGQSCRDEYIGHILQGNIKQALLNKREISIEEILDPIRDQKLILMEGAPGIGKSTLAWELCRKWEELSCMQQYSLVVLLRLREEIVQQISEISQLFISSEYTYKKSLVDYVSKNQGKSVLFILDGFDELPKTLQQKSFLLDLMKGYVLPASTVVVTSRPSATAELLSSCHPKHIEILGFTQDSVEAYASSIFSSEPEKFKKFMNYISASENPAINSLMYVPLNAAIIVQIYLDSKSDILLPHTFKELYTLLCITILNRDLKIRVEKLEDLPTDLHKQFLHLSNIAFEGILHERVIFHTLPRDLVHFGFLDAVSALYGGGQVSYNFLHLTLQEFFAAYHISNLGSSGLEVFKQHGRDKRWNVVWRFVAGLTQFKHYEGHINSDMFINEPRIDHDLPSISMFYFQCLFEAQSINYFSLILPPNIYASVDSTSLDAYALGFCISNFHFEASWSVKIMFTRLWKTFLCGLTNNTAGRNIPHVGSLYVHSCSVNANELKALELLPHLTSLSFKKCVLNNADVIPLSELISHMNHLSELCISFNHNNGLLQILRQLSQSTVTSLDIVDTGIDRLLRYSPCDYFSALKELVCPSSGKLNRLHVSGGDDFYDHGRLASIVSAPSSLKYLELLNPYLSEHMPYLKENSNLTQLKLTQVDFSRQASHITEIVKYNKTLKDLELQPFNVRDIAAVRMIVNALPGNNTLQSIVLRFYGAEFRNDIYCYMITHHKELTLDTRVMYIGMVVL